MDTLGDTLINVFFAKSVNSSSCQSTTEQMSEIWTERHIDINKIEHINTFM